MNLLTSTLPARCLLGLLTVAFTAAVQGAEPGRRVRDVNSLRQAISGAKPGDRILIEPGEYRGNLYFKNVHGSVTAPIVIAAADPAKPPRLIGKAVCLQFSVASHIELQDLELSNASDNGLVFDDGDHFERPAHHITIRNVRVHDIGPKGNCDGIKLSGVDQFTLENCTVDHWGDNGSGIDMVGCHRGTIANCTFTHGGFNAVQIKGGSADITVRNCKLEDYGERGVNIGGFTGDGLFRPPLKTLPADRKYEARNIRVEGCTFIGGKAAIAFTNMDGSVVRFNTIYRPENYAFRILQEKTDAAFVPCRDGMFQDNVVVFRSERWADGGVNVGPNTAPQTFRFARNLWFCEDRPQQSAPKLPTPGRDEVVGQDPRFRDAAKGDFTVPAGSPAAGRGALALPKAK